MPPKKQTQTVKAYVVRRKNWEYNDEFFDCYGDGTPVQTFLRREAAEEYRRKCEATSDHDGLNPFELGGNDLSDQTSLTPTELAERLAAAGLKPPRRPEGYGEFSDWWSVHEKSFTPEQRAAVWEALDRVSFFEVAEVEIDYEPGTEGV